MLCSSYFSLVCTIECYAFICCYFRYHKIQVKSSSSSSLPLTMSQSRAHSRAVVFHTLHRGLRDTKLCPHLFTCTMIYPSVFSSILLFPTWPDVPPRLPPSHVSVSPLFPSSKTPLPSPTTLSLVLLISPSFSSPLAGFKFACHYQRQWTFTERLPLTGSNQCLAGHPKAWVLAPLTVRLVVLESWGGQGSSR